ncbi:ribosomal RNA small subunit methyltransferase G [Endomicrobiia bacterium]|nr:ribosomal RNA small subunit methyltransferase G [Endomicrobiia bacterium]GHT13238.1 ribosomal RNA small subunit methyltransferase G [Endomicrobiia bacterium]GHT18718.1 ribosomal RNA small subunit methyltransferase G [Endomicrobiia bacterium]GHT29880.1 ribosomal RNA small subunit methyltransferase G [Endomicrobiia bacterium]
MSDFIENETLFTEFEHYAVKNVIPFFSKETRKKFETYFYELNKWNKKFNLISFKNVRDLVYRHFCDSLYSAKAISDILTVYQLSIYSKRKRKREGAGRKQKSAESAFKVADLGTGSGMPGIPVKIALPCIKLTLIESITKKCRFLNNINNKLGFNTEILNKRAEEIGQNTSYRQQYDFILSRAVSKLSPNLEISIPLLKIGGYFIVHKTKKSAESSKDGLQSAENALKHLGAKLERTIYYNLPEYESDYCILIFKKHKDTPANFPRKSGIPEKNPL